MWLFPRTPNILLRLHHLNLINFQHKTIRINVTRVRHCVIKAISVAYARHGTLNFSELAFQSRSCFTICQYILSGKPIKFLRSLRNQFRLELQ